MFVGPFHDLSPLERAQCSQLKDYFLPSRTRGLCIGIRSACRRELLPSWTSRLARHAKVGNQIVPCIGGETVALVQLAFNVPSWLNSRNWPLPMYCSSIAPNCPP